MQLNSRTGWVRGTILWIAILGISISCHEPHQDEESATPSTIAPPKLIILISIDTLRADHLTLYGHSRFTSPRIDLFASEGVTFLDASSVAPWTLPAHASLFTGLYPQQHGAVGAAYPLSKEVPTLAEKLKAAGWDTAAVVNTIWLGNPQFQLQRGFEDFLFIQDEADRKLPNDQITNQAMAWLEKERTAPLFLFIHYYDVHSDYTSLSRYEKKFVEPYEGEIDGTGLQLQLINLPDEYVDMCKKAFDPEKCTLGSGPDPIEIGKNIEKPTLEENDIQHLKTLYDAGIRQMDDELGRLFSFLENRGLLEEGVVVITSDHGEEFMEHGRVFHHLTTYQESLRIPLIMRGEGLPQGVKIETPVSIVDIPATILSWAGLSPGGSVAGMDLTPLLDPQESSRISPIFHERMQFGEASAGVDLVEVMGESAPFYFSVRQGPYKLIYRVGEEKPVLYDLSADPEEQMDVAALHPERTERLWNALQERRAKNSPAQNKSPSIELDPLEIERLRALGYVIP